MKIRINKRLLKDENSTGINGRFCFYLYCKWDKFLHFKKSQTPSSKPQNPSPTCKPFGIWVLRFGIWNLLKAGFYRVSCIVILFIVLITNNIYGQEKIVPLEYNAVLNKNHPVNTCVRYKRSGTDSIKPFNLDSNDFFDDFSEGTFFTNKKYWLDDYVFINNDLAYRPVSVGVATFDGLNQYGNPYDAGFGGEDQNAKGALADKLTSVPIDLSRYHYSDSLYLSFYYQPQGLGDAPEQWDSLALEFKPDSIWQGTVWDDSSWVRIWSVTGSGLKPFKQVMIPIKLGIFNPGHVPDTLARFYHKAFQFRFVNYANLSGNLDLWHIDYVYLAKGRSRHDTAYNDISIVDPPTGVINNYRAMPWLHLKKHTSQFADTIMIIGRNNYNNSLNFRMGYIIQDEKQGDTLLHDFNTNSQTLSPKQLYSHNVIDHLNLRTAFPLLHFDSAGYNSTVLVRTTLLSYNSDNRNMNNYSHRVQEFSNYYAYDDGTAENGYGLDLKQYLLGKVAIQFNILEEDTLRGIAMFFNKSKADVSNEPFKLCVWKDAKEKNPDYVMNVTVPSFSDTVTNDFYVYKFDTVGFVVKGTIFIGWEQTEKFIMNVGLDRNYYQMTADTIPVDGKDNPNLFIYYQNKWSHSSYSGALMMRPIIGKSIPLSMQPSDRQIKKTLFVFPNPANDVIYLKNLDEAVDLIQISDISGRNVLTGRTINNKISVNELKPGFYILRIFDSKGLNIFNTRIIINH